MYIYVYIRIYVYIYLRANWSLPVDVCNDVMIISVSDALTFLTFTFRTTSTGVLLFVHSHICKMRQQGWGSLHARGGFFSCVTPACIFFIVIHLQLIFSPASVEDTMNGGKYVSRRDSKSARSVGGPNARSAEAREPREDVIDRSSSKNRGASGAVVEEQLAVSRSPQPSISSTSSPLLHRAHNSAFCAEEGGSVCSTRTVYGAHTAQ